ncbi:MAG: hypothetical protein JXP73_16805 [Deltaproteobacteria bacterium]|jgi:hypothetical protein|nr:hypothetical protein [Deltaproteobacteria bacterium]
MNETKDIEVRLSRGGNPLVGQTRHFSIDEAGVPLRDLLGPNLRGSGAVDVFFRHDSREVLIPPEDLDVLSLHEAMRRVSGGGSTQAGVFTIDATAAHEGALHA